MSADPNDICFCGDYRYQHAFNGMCRVCRIHPKRTNLQTSSYRDGVCWEFRHDKIKQDMEALDRIIDSAEQMETSGD